MSNLISKYRPRVIARHRDAFRFHTKLIGGIEEVLAVPRTHRSLERLVIDMLMLQCFKSYATVSLLAQHGLMEDTATTARRLMELSVAAVYIGAESEARLRKRRSGMYLAFMWRQLPPRVRQKLPPRVRRQWAAIARSYARFVPAKAKRWGPSWFDMFREMGQEALYRTDYAFLSSVAHGNPDNQLFAFSAKRIRIHDERFASALLIYSTRYCLAALEQWNRRFPLIDKPTFDGWVRKAVSWRCDRNWS